ncbi:type II toxin-antitoxin system HicA family toxin [Brucella anthropi]|nr:type II toxin-antitoxin system HicA family toxin [Brucella anthropi]
MAQGEKRFDQMRQNPRDWRIEDVAVVCKWAGVECCKPSSGSHYGVAHSSQRAILTIPADRPINPVYIRLLVKFIDAVLRSKQ